MVVCACCILSSWLTICAKVGLAAASVLQQAATSFEYEGGNALSFEEGRRKCSPRDTTEV